MDDGPAGLWTVKDSGGLALVQDPRHAMHSPMPQSAIEHVKVDLVGTCDELAGALGQIASKNAASTPQRSQAPWRCEEEVKIASEGNGLQLGLMNMGKVSQYTCPDCHGVLVQIEEGSIVRFRCHTGHAFSLQTLLAEVNESIDKGLWDTIRAIEERVLLLRQMSHLQSQSHTGKEPALDQLADDAQSPHQGDRGTGAGGTR